MTQFESELAAHVTKMLGSRDEAEDILQVVWMRAHTSPPELPDEGSPRAWLYRVATNAALDRLRVERRRATALAAEPRTEAVSFEEPELDDRVRARIRAACAALPRKQRDAVWHRWIEQEDYETVARKLDSNVETVRANVYHGLKRLRLELEDVWLGEDR